MRYAGITFFIALLGFTRWAEVSQPQVNILTHYNIQKEMSELIERDLLKKHPGVREIKFLSLHTETLGPDQVKARFRYTYKDADGDGTVTKNGIVGWADLSRIDAENDKWTLGKIQILSSSIDFEGDPKSRAVSSVPDSPQ